MAGLRTDEQAVPAMCWMAPEWRGQFAVGSESGVRVYRLATESELKAQSGAAAGVTAVEYIGTHHPVTALAAAHLAGAALGGGALAVGSAVGSVQVQMRADSGSADGAETAGEIVRVYAPSGRACRALAFNEAHGRLLACGFGSGGCGGGSGSQPRVVMHDLSRGRDVRQLLQTADSDGDGAGAGTRVTSLAWVPGSVDDVLVASRNSRGIVRLYDLRAASAGETVLHVSADSGPGDAGMVYDVQFDPFNSVRYLAHDRRGGIGMWDLRWPARALHTAAVNVGGAVQRVAYSPRRRGVLAAMGAGGAVAVMAVNEFVDGRPGSAGVASASAVLEEARTRDHYYEDDGDGARDAATAAAATAVAPDGLQVWTEHETIVGGAGACAAGAFLWVPVAASQAAVRCEQLVAYGVDGTLQTLSLPAQRMAAFSCRGDVAVSTNWHALRGVSAASEVDMLSLHASAAEVRELTAAAAAAAAAGTAAEAEGGRGLRAATVPGDADVQAVMAQDVLVLMRQRALRGYGGGTADANARILHGDFWRWVRDADIRRRSGAYFVALRSDASFFGVLSLLRLTRRQTQFLREHGGGSGGGAGGGSGGSAGGPMGLDHMQPVHRGSRMNAGRALALVFCGWDLAGRVRERHICALEAAGEFAAAAGTAFVYGDRHRCLQALERSSAQDQKLLSFMLKAQISDGPLSSSGSQQHQNHQHQPSAAPPDMFECAHLQMIFTYLVTRDWTHVLAAMQARGMPLATRVALALRHLGDAALMRYLGRVAREGVEHGNLDALLVTGITGSDAGRRVLQAYVDRTGDVQTAALAVCADPEDAVSSGVSSAGAGAAAAAAADVGEQWIYAYRHLLNMWRMFTTRCLFDIAHGNAREAKGLPRMSRVGEEVALRPADVRCTFCHQGLGYDVNKWRAAQLRAQKAAAAAGLGDVAGGIAQPATPTSGKGAAGGSGGGPPGVLMAALPDPRLGRDGGVAGVPGGGGAGGGAGPMVAGASMVAGTGGGSGDQQKSQSRLLYTICPKCGNNLPRCVVCRMTLGTPVVGAQASAEECVALGGDFAQWFSWCQTCGHGGHVAHMQSWFATHEKCPIPGCECECEKCY
ncbi:hypothetical protein LPJ53_005931 [Coemansia erecta]|uniref:GATOR2 complex protein MIO zinc-ribbon like domain-containing protein n=1 Tax=Coemansia erecta TaxID=147472 RepID=A0A9W7XV67_9FUNG|nr:hypothetical protein LPJ53_005931 [Coemansia erecta]